MSEAADKYQHQPKPNSFWGPKSLGTLPTPHSMCTLGAGGHFIAPILWECG